MNLLIENASQIVTCSSKGKKYLSGKEQRKIGLIENSSLFIENGLIKFIGKKIPRALLKKADNKINAHNKVVFPGFIDSHTHLVFAGDRANEYSMRIDGKSYEQIAKAGGGIINTVNAVRKTSKEKLKNLASERVERFISFGVTTLEAKSGYGLDTENEIKMLEVINELSKQSLIDILPTFLASTFYPKKYVKEGLYGFNNLRNDTSGCSQKFSKIYRCIL